MDCSKSGNERLSELEAYHIIGTGEETDYDSLTKIAAEICQTQMALVCLKSKDRQFLKSPYGIDLKEAPLDATFFVHAIREPEQVFIVEDAAKDERFRENPWVISSPHILFFAAFSLVSKEGIPLGVLSVMDVHPKKLNEIQIHSLKVLANQIVQLLKLRRHIQKSEKEYQASDGSATFE